MLEHDLHDALREVLLAATHDLDRELGREREQRLALDEFGFAVHGVQAARACLFARMTSFLNSWYSCHALRKTGPGLPEPMRLPSRSTMATISLDEDVTHTSS